MGMPNRRIPAERVDVAFGIGSSCFLRQKPLAVAEAVAADGGSGLIRFHAAALPAERTGFLLGHVVVRQMTVGVEIQNDVLRVVIIPVLADRVGGLCDLRVLGGHKLLARFGRFRLLGQRSVRQLLQRRNAGFHDLHRVAHRAAAGHQQRQRQKQRQNPFFHGQSPFSSRAMARISASGSFSTRRS